MLLSKIKLCLKPMLIFSTPNFYKHTEKTLFSHKWYSIDNFQRNNLFTSLPSETTVYNEKQFELNQKHQQTIQQEYKHVLSSVSHGGGEKATERHVKLNKKLIVSDRLNLLLDDNTEFFELSPLAGLDMSYGTVPKAGCVTGIGTIAGIQCMIIANDATVKGGTIYPITIKKQLRAQEIAKKNNLPCVYIVDSGGAFLPLQAEIFPDKEMGGRCFYNEAILNSLNIPQLSIVCGSCTAGAAYIPTMCQEALIVHKIGTIFLAGPPLVFAALGEMVSPEDLGGATLHSSVSGCTDHFSSDERDGFSSARSIIATFNYETKNITKDHTETLNDVDKIAGLIPADQYEPINVYQLLTHLVDGGKFQEFKKTYGRKIVTGFCHIKGNLVGIISNQQTIDEYAAIKASHFVQICNQRQIPIVFLQNSSGSKETEGDASIGEIKAHAMLMNSVTCASVPKITIACGTVSHLQNYLMCGRSFSPNFLFSWPNAQLSCNETYQDSEVTSETQDVKSKLFSSVHGSSRLWDDGIILPEDSRNVIANCLNIFDQSRNFQEKQMHSPSSYQSVFRM